ncbi:hypothetical protein G5B30_10685 [Sphingobacterium sp. SGG-5]|uniref:hypothetical protein n=1 Tax=Sphingobacterium sp. SGG-5 TaxID=2710881 RepID=UPI0013EAD570|nr:hypothetical protein [Sphingobacterium sp. SGG-5]NGM62379.1 hypothetical protein [Sphingobacterium sp. SGG-5]
MIKFKNYVLPTLMVLFIVSAAKSQEQPVLKSRSFKTHSYDATKLPSEAGFMIIVDQTPLGRASIKDSRLFIDCKAGESYRMGLTPETDIKFNPQGDYTIEFKVQVPKNTGRGFDFMIKDGLNMSKLLVVHHNRIYFNGEKEPIINVQSRTVPRVVRVAVERSNSLMHIYVDGKFAKTVELVKRRSTPSLLFAKGNVNSATEIYIDYITVDESGAYAP